MGGKLRLFLLLVGLGAVMLVLTTCAPGDVVKIGVDSNGGSVELKSGQALAVTLESNPSTGYAWVVDEVDPALLRQEGDAEYQPDKTAGENIVGAGGTETFRFSAIAAGETTLKLVYRRSWETGIEPAQIFSVQVKITP